MTVGAAVGLGLVTLGGIGLFGMRLATRRGSVAMLDTTDRVLAGGDHAIRLARTVQFGTDPAQHLHLFVPTDRTLDPALTGRALPLVLFIHGGGWASGNPGDYRFIARIIAPHGYAVALAGYRLHPLARYPHMLEDGAAAIAWLATHAAALGGDPAQIVLIGHSAGAYNAVMLGLDRRWIAATGEHLRRICGVIGLAGPYDFLPLDDHTTIATFGHVADLRETQPVHHVRGDAPPVLLIHGDADRRVRPRHSMALARALAGVGARSETHMIAGIGHEGLIMRFARPFVRDRRALSLVLNFLARVTARPADDHGPAPGADSAGAEPATASAAVQAARA